MRKITLLVTLLAGVAATQGHAQAPAQSDDAALIASAMQAAPKSIAEGATIIAMGPDHKIRTIREGNNGWTCMPDTPTTQAPDPMCMDANAREWAHAWLGRKEPPAGKIGFIYMLAGDTGASNIDPYAEKRTSDNQWIAEGPHIMVLLPDPAQLDAPPTDPNQGGPYVMWKGTPYAHIMVPVGERPPAANR